MTAFVTSVTKLGSCLHNNLSTMTVIITSLQSVARNCIMLVYIWRRTGRQFPLGDDVTNAKQIDRVQCSVIRLFMILQKVKIMLTMRTLWFHIVHYYRDIHKRRRDTNFFRKLPRNEMYNLLKISTVVKYIFLKGNWFSFGKITLYKTFMIFSKAETRRELLFALIYENIGHNPWE